MADPLGLLGPRLDQVLRFSRAEPPSSVAGAPVAGPPDISDPTAGLSSNIPDRPPVEPARETTSVRHKGDSTKLDSSRLARHVEEIIKKADQNFGAFVKELTKPLPDMRGVPHGQEVKASFERSLDVMARAGSLYLTVEAGNSLRSMIKTVVDKMLEMKD